MIDSKRRTGRTTRMIEAAIDAAARGQEVLIVMPNSAEASRVAEFISRRGDATLAVIARIRVQSAFVAGRIHGDTARPENARFNEACFVDHFVFEQRWRTLFEAWTAYDLPTPVVYNSSLPDSLIEEPFVPRKRRMILGDSS